MTHRPAWEVAITGIGLVTPLGLTAAASLETLLNCKSALACVPEAEGGYAASQVPPFDASSVLRNPKNLKLLSRPVRMALLATHEAVEHAGLDGASDPNRTGVYVGSGQTGLDYDEFLRAFTVAWEGGREQDYKYLGGMPSKLIDRYFSLRTLANAGVAAISTEFNARGPSNNYVQGETAAAIALLHACQDLLERRCDTAIVCGYENLLVPSVLLAARQQNLLSGNGFQPLYTPFHPFRQGIVLGEAAACFLLERRSDANARYACVLGEVDGIGVVTQTDDEPGFTAPDRDICAAAEMALSGCASDFVVARGLGTQADDLAESRALTAFLPPTLPVTAFKGQTGYLGAATSAVELALGLLSARSGLLPPVHGLDVLDPAIALNLAQAGPVALPLNARGLFFSSSFSGQVAVIAAHAVSCPSDASRRAHHG